jgi:hypothetical protein
MTTILDTQTGLLTKEETSQLADYLTSTGEFFIHTLKGLSPEDWAKIPADNGWTPAECADHLHSVEMAFKAQVDRFLATPPALEKIASVQGKETMIRATLESRKHKIKGAPTDRKEAFDIDKSKIITEFEQKRKEMVEFIKSANAPLKAHFTSFPGIGDLNVYQYCIFIAAHTIRHTLQIQEALVE